jgi:hypothetical protein
MSPEDGSLLGCCDDGGSKLLETSVNIYQTIQRNIPEDSLHQANSRFVLACYGTRRFITVFTRARQWSVSWVRSIQSTPSHPISSRSILILSSNLRIGRLISLLLSDWLKFYKHFSSLPCMLYVQPISVSSSQRHLCQFLDSVIVIIMELFITQTSPFSSHFLAPSSNIILSFLYSGSTPVQPSYGSTLYISSLT